MVCGPLFLPLLWTLQMLEEILSKPPPLGSPALIGMDSGTPVATLLK